MEEEDATSGNQLNRQYVQDSLHAFLGGNNRECCSTSRAPCFSGDTNQLSLVITDPENPKFDLEAFLKLKAGEA